MIFNGDITRENLPAPVQVQSFMSSLVLIGHDLREAQIDLFYLIWSWKWLC